MEVTVFAIKEDDKVDDIPCAAVVKKVGRNLIEESIRKFIKQQLNVTEEAKFIKNIYMYVPKNILFYESLQELPLESMTERVSKTYLFQSLAE